MKRTKMDTLAYILKKYQLENSPVIEIPNIGRDVLALLLHELDYKIGVEVGVQHGAYSEVLCKANPQMKIYGVDPWESFKNSLINSPDKKTENLSSQAVCDQWYHAATERLSAFPNYNILKEYSVDAVKKFKDESLDFVYIDANHKYPFVLDDITKWSPKVKKGGIVAGHDYYNTKYRVRVKQAVHHYIQANNISPLIIFGLRGRTQGIFRDYQRSWMWVKP